MDDGRGRPHVQQLLFGYDDGHKLLAKSTELPGQVARRLLVAGDFAVSGEWAGRRPYLTGAPVDEMSAYAISGTWPAPEMKRPGCVWTHTLMIGFPDLARLSDLGQLVRLLRRPPEGGYSLRGYDEPLTIDPGVKLHTEPPAAVLSLLLEALYGEPGTTCVAYSAGESAVDALTALWSQQWPRLRRTFRFASRASEDRESNRERSEDLLLMAKGPSRRRFPSDTLELGIDLIAGERLADREGAGPEWLEESCRDALGHSDGSLRNFLRRYGADVTGGRAAFVGLVEVHRLVHRAKTSSPTDLGRLLVKHFAGRSEAGKLKADLIAGRLGAQAGGVQRKLRWTEAVVTSSPGVMEIFEPRLALAWLDELAESADREQLWLSLQRTSGRDCEDWRELLLDVLADHAPAEEALRRESSTRVYADLATRNATFLELADAWRRPELAYRLMRIAFRKGLAPARVIQLAMAADDPAIASEILGRFGPLAAEGIIRALEDGHEPNSAWTAALGSSAVALAEGMERFGSVKARTISSLFACLDRSSTVPEVPARHWAAFTRAATGPLPKRERIPLAMRLFLIGIGRPGPGSEELLARTFEPLHEAASKDEIDPMTWDRLEEHLPGRWTYWYWDRCERLRCATCDAFMATRMEPWRFLELASKRRTFEALIRTLLYRHGGYDFATKLRSVDGSNLSEIARKNWSIIERW